MTDKFPDLDDETVTIESIGDYVVNLDIDGVAARSVAVDYYEDTPRLLVHADEREEPSHIIELPTEEGDDE